jgi:hypothetical protein
MSEIKRKLVKPKKADGKCCSVCRGDLRVPKSRWCFPCMNVKAAFYTIGIWDVSNFIFEFIGLVLVYLYQVETVLWHIHVELCISRALGTWALRALPFIFFFVLCKSKNKKT